MFTRDQILDEIRRVAAELGAAPGRRTFATESGVQPSDWQGRYWARWSDALAEAGLPANVLNQKLDDATIMRALAEETRRLGRFPGKPDLQMRRRDDPTFPSHNVFAARGRRADLIELLRDWCRHARGEDWGDVVALLPEPPARLVPKINRQPEVVLGQVYLLRLGKHYKIGRSNAFGRRERELAIQMPERAVTVHVINTDDPVGIEAYWHRRFADRRTRPDAEWFELSPDDVRAFRRRKFQ